MIDALLREREGYEASGKDDRVKAVDEQLKMYGYKSEGKDKEDKGSQSTGRDSEHAVTGGKDKSDSETRKSESETRNAPPVERSAERQRQTAAPEVKPL